MKNSLNTYEPFPILRRSTEVRAKPSTVTFTKKIFTKRQWQKLLKEITRRKNYHARNDVNYLHVVEFLREVDNRPVTLREIRQQLVARALTEDKNPESIMDILDLDMRISICFKAWIRRFDGGKWNLLNRKNFKNLRHRITDRDLIGDKLFQLQVPVA